MPSILDDFPYPWPNKVAQQLHITLCRINSSTKNTELAAAKSGIDTTQIFFDQPVYLIWVEILDFASAHGVLRTLVEDVYERLAATSPYRSFLEDLISNKAIVIDAEPRGENGSPIFVGGNDEIKELEALLYRDDLTLQVGKLPQLISTLNCMIALSPAICRLIVDINGMEQKGTGFRIAQETLLTNWHVLHNPGTGVRATAVTAEFLYEDDGVGGVLTSKPITCDVKTIFAVKEDDWGIIKVNDKMDDAWPKIHLSEAVAPQVGSATYIIQHPGGERKRIGFIRNQVSDFDERVVHYLTDTQTGSSGSPVFDQSGKIMALHHAGGRPQEVIGRPPLSKNEGIRISRIIERLQKEQIDFA